MLKKVTTIITISFCVLTMNVFAQSAEEAYDLYQQGIKAVGEKNYEAAIKDLTASLTMYEAITDLEGAEVVKESAQKALAQTYYAYAVSLNQEKEFDKAIEQFKNAENFAVATNNEEIADRASSFVGRVYLAKASATFTDKQYDETIAAADEVLKMDAENEMAYFWRGRAYREQGDLTKMKADLDKCMELSKDDEQKEKTYSNAAKIAGAAYMAAGADALKAKKYTDAIANLEIATSYPEINANAFYYLAVAYNALSKWNDAVTAAEKALTMDLKDPSATYFELGKAYEGAGKKTEACAAYKKVTSEQYKKNAEYQMQTVLKCN